MSRHPRPLVSLGLFSFLLGAQCDRAPAEPVVEAPRRERCTRTTPDQAPPPVAPGPDPRCPADPDGGPPKVPQGRVRFPQAPKAPAVDVEVMDTEPNRNRGLMYRRELADARGMLFVFDGEAPRSFWMHNTCLPLDMVFVAADGYIVSVVENVPTLNDEPRDSKCAAKYVVEVNAGFCRKYGVKAGQQLAIEGP